MRVASTSHTFNSWLAVYFERFVALQRSSGYVYLSQARILRAFDRYVAQYGNEPPLEAPMMSRYLAALDHLSPRSRDNVVAVVWPALSYAQRQGAPIDTPDFPEDAPPDSKEIHKRTLDRRLR